MGSCLSSQAVQQKQVDPGPAEPEYDLKSMSISDAIQECWKRDTNRLRPDVDYKINVQKGKTPYWPEDKAADPLFSKVDRSVWKRPTYSKFVALLDNYKSRNGKEEPLGETEFAKINAFLDAVMQTGPMKFCHAFCHAKQPENISTDPKAFQKLLFRIWFERYRREKGGKLDSSGFEQVFVGKVRNGEIIGFHNWIRFYMEEAKGMVDYRGYIKSKAKEDAMTDSNDHVLTLQFRWKGVEKKIGTIFVGVSPEWEMAIYTMCFLSGSDRNRVELRTDTDIFEIEIICHKIDRDRIGSIYPYILAHR